MLLPVDCYKYLRYFLLILKTYRLHAIHIVNSFVVANLIRNTKSNASKEKRKKLRLNLNFFGELYGL